MAHLLEHPNCVNTSIFCIFI